MFDALKDGFAASGFKLRIGIGLITPVITLLFMLKNKKVFRDPLFDMLNARNRKNNVDNENDENNVSAAGNTSNAAVVVDAQPEKANEVKTDKLTPAEWIADHKIALFIGIIILALLIAGALSIVKTIKKVKAVATELNTEETYILTKRDVNDAISLTGTIESNQAKSVAVDLSGVKIEAVNVEVGDVVQKGDILCVLDSSVLEKKLGNIEKVMAEIEQNSKMSTEDSERNQAQTVFNGNVNVMKADESVTKAQEDYNLACQAASYAHADYQDALAKVEEKKEDLEDAKDEYDKAKKKYKDHKDDPDAATYATKKEAADAAVDTAEDAVKAAEDAAETARRTYEDKCNAMSSYEREMNDANLDKNTAVNNFVNDYADNQDNITKAKTSDTTDNLENQLTKEELQEDIALCTVSAPIAGRITAVGVDAGRKYNGTEICVIQDDKDLVVKAIVDQYDISDIIEGQEAVVRTDTTGEEEMTGKVTFVSPTPETETNATTGVVTNTTNYPIKITLDHPNERLRLGMTAKINVLLESRKNVFAVPYDCIQTDDDGKRYITVMNSEKKYTKKEIADAKKVLSDKEATDKERSDALMIVNSSIGSGGAKENKYVTVGMETDYYTEISGEGLEEGLEILVPPVQEEEADLTSVE